MGFNEIRVNKARNDREIEEIVDRLIQSGEFNPLLLVRPVLTGFKHLKRGALNDYEQTLTEQDAPSEMFWQESEKEARIEQLAHCATEHFQSHYIEKLRIALIELMHESMAFAHPILLKDCEAGEKEIEDAKPLLADLQQNVLRQSILRLKNLPYRKREGVDGEENNEALTQLSRTSAEIYNHMAFWAYDHVRVYQFLRQDIRSIMEDIGRYDDPDYSSHLAANDAAEFIWDNIDGAMQTMTYILVEYSMLLATPSLKQRNPKMFTRRKLRENQPSASDLKKIAARWLDPWFDVLTVKLSKRGRIPKDESNRVSERAQFKRKAINAMLCVLDEPEKISQWRVSKILNIGNWRNKHDRTLYNHLNFLNLEWKKLKDEAEKIHQKKRTKN